MVVLTSTSVSALTSSAQRDNFFNFYNFYLVLFTQKHTLCAK